MWIRVTFFLSLVILSFSSIGTVLAEVSLTSTCVSYTASRTAHYSGPLGRRSWTVTLALEFDANYFCSWDGDPPGVSNVHLNVTPIGGKFTVSWDIRRPWLPDSLGTIGPLPLPLEGQNLLGDYPLPSIPIDIGTIEIVVHGLLVGDLTPNAGTVSPSSVEWSTWGSQDTELMTSTESVVLGVETKYVVYATVSVYVQDFPVVSIDSESREFLGDSPAVFVVRSSADIVPPIADAGLDQTVDEDALTYFDGSASSDDVGIVSYTWTLVDETKKILTGEDTAYTFNTPGDYVVTLNVSDAAGNWNTDTVTIIVLDKTPPTIETPDMEPSGDVEQGQEVKISVSITDVSGVKNCTLYYTLDNGTLWKTHGTMTYNSITGHYETTIPGQLADTLVKYQITAYDNAENHYVKDNNGTYYVYAVIPEFSSIIMLQLFILTTLLVAVLHKRKDRFMSAYRA